MHKNFTFKGVVRSNDNLFANEGECMELVNLRMVNGSLKPIPEMVEKAVLPEKYSRIYWHDKASCYICIMNDAPNGVCFYNSDWQPLLDSKGEKLCFPMLEKVKSIEILGYIVVCITENGMRYLVYGNGTYRWLGEYPPIPNLAVTLSSKLYSITTDSAFNQDYINTDISSTWNYNSRGYFDECISKANKDGHYIDRALFRFALRLYDGSYIYSSHIIYVSDENEKDGVTRDAGNLSASPVSSSEDSSRYRVSVLAFKPLFEFSNLQLQEWEGIIVGIDVFTCGSIMGKKIDAATTTIIDTATKQRVTEKYEMYKDKELDELWSDISGASLFYKVAEFDIKGNLLNAVDDVSQANIVLQDALSGSEQQMFYSSVVPGCSYMFNNRLHIASLREYFFKGYDRFSLLPVGGETAVVDILAVMTRIKTQNGISEVVNECRDVEVGYKDDTFQLPPYLMYPDSRAFEMRLFLVYETETFMKTLPLTPHKFLNQSYYLHKWSLGYDVTVKAVYASGRVASGITKALVLEVFNYEEGVHEVVYSSATGGWVYKGAAFPPEEFSGIRIFQIPRDIVNGDKLVFTITKSTSDTTFRDIRNIPFDETWQLVGGPEDYRESNVYEEKENVMKVSMVDNPFVFPAKCTYSLSQGKVVALSTNRTPMSEGQFGEHPLYVFSQEGIEVMSVDASGTVAYSNMYPVSHEVCLNAGSVCGIDSGVLFLGAQGVMLIGGSRCIHLSAAMDNDAVENEAIKRSGIIGRIASLNGFGGVVDGASFIDFMRTAKVARFPEMDEIVFCNDKFNYSFVYSVPGKVWSKMSNAFAGFVKTGGSFAMFSHKEEKTCIYVPGDTFSGCNRILLVTRPFLFGTKLPKRIMQLMLHAYLAKPENASQTPFVSCFLLCSNDGVHFKLVSGCDRSSETRDIVFPYFPTCSYRYYIFALTGNVVSKSMITGLEIDVSAAWSNRLR
jgi:hypothetical protein